MALSETDKNRAIGVGFIATMFGITVLNIGLFMLSLPLALIVDGSLALAFGLYTFHLLVNIP